MLPIGEQPEDMGARILGTAPPRNGTRFAVIDFPPGNQPHMHRTETVDYVIVMEGEIEMDMDASTVKLKAGDIMIQRGTNHAWANRSGKRARVAFVLVDAEPLAIGAPVTGLHSAQIISEGSIDVSLHPNGLCIAHCGFRDVGLGAELSEWSRQADRSNSCRRRHRCHGPCHRPALAGDVGPAGRR